MCIRDRSCDAHHIVSPHPEGAGALRAMQAALKNAQLAPTDLDWICAHGTGTRANDRAEVLAARALCHDPVSYTHLAAISALSISPVMLLWVMVFHIIVVELESHVLAPALYGKVIGVHPALMLIALLIGAKLGGVLGVFFAVPSTVELLTLVQELRGLYAGSVPTQL